MAGYRTAQGKIIDMSNLVAKNEKIRAVGNMNVNARGDILDSHNEVVTDNMKRVKKTYSDTVTTQPSNPQTPQKTETALADLTPEERELFESDDEEIEKK